MHETPESRRLAAQMVQLVGSEGWPVVVELFISSERTQIQVMRADPLSPESQAAAVKLAHIEELRNALRSATPTECGDPFDVAKRPSEAWNGRDPGPEPDEDDYDL